MSSSTCSPEPAPASPPRTSSRRPRRSSRTSTRPRKAMSIRTEPFVAVARPPRPAVSLSLWLDRESVFSWLMMSLPLLFLATMVGYPLVYGVLLSLQDRPVAHAGHFVGLKNFVHDFHDPIFWRVAVNTFVYTGAAT